MAEGSWQESIPYIADGEPVEAGVANRPDMVLEQNARYLLNRVNAASLGAAIVAYNATMSPSVLPNQPVAWNPATQRFEPALAQAVTDPATGSYVAAWSAEVVGVCSQKYGTTAGDIVLAGRYETDLANAVDGTPTPGRYYLSTSSPGKLLPGHQPLAVAVLSWDGTYAYVAPATHQFLESHVHHRVRLACRPAGVSHLASGAYTVTSPNPNLPGWLPARHAVFNNRAPAGASFGYNLAAHPELKAIWPAQPIDSVVVSWDKGAGTVGATLVPLGPNGLVALTRDGIWWMSDCPGDVPWPANYDANDPPDDVSANSSAGAECPRLVEMQLTLSFTEMLFATDKSVVTSISAAAGSPIVVTDCDGEPASRGAVVLDVDLNFVSDDSDALGSLAFKELDGTTLKRGRVTEGLVAGANVSMSSTASRPLDGTPGAATVHQGIVTLNVDTNLADREVQPTIVQLFDAVERQDPDDVPFLGFPASRNASIRCSFALPSAGLPASPKAKVRLWVYGDATGTLPATTMSYRRLPRPTGAPVSLPATDTSLACNTNLSIAADQYREFESALIDVVAGDTLLVSFNRSAADGYSGQVGILKIVAVVVAG